MTTSTGRETALRADARRNIAAILDAATICLARDPEASINTIAQAAGVGRMTLYGHFPNRGALVAAATERAMASTEAQLAALDLTGAATEAMSRLLKASWQLTHRFGALTVAAEKVLSENVLHEAHDQPMKRVRAILRRGRREGCFRTDLPVEWQITTIHSILHGASAAVHRGEIKESQAPTLIVKTVLAALAG